MLRTKQVNPDRKGWATHCGQDKYHYPCTHNNMAKDILDATWEHFLAWKGERNNIR